MGLHICLLKNGIDHPDWDYIRQGHDRDFTTLIDFSKVEYEGPCKDTWRPINIHELKYKIGELAWDDSNRYLNLLDILEQDRDVWVYFSW